MKKTITTFFIAFLFLLINKANAQTYEVGNNVLSLGVGLGSSLGYTNSTQSPALSIQFERGITELGSSGVLSIGGYFGVKNYKYDYSYFGYSFSQKWNYTLIGLRGAYHFTGLDVDKVDLYGGVMLGYYILTYKYTDNDPTHDDNFYNSNQNFKSTAGFSLYGGARYFFTEKIGAFLELGYGISYLNLGLAIKF